LTAACLSRRLFSMNGSATTPLWLWWKMLFALCILLGTWLLLSTIASADRRRRGKEPSFSLRHGGID